MTAEASAGPAAAQPPALVGNRRVALVTPAVTTQRYPCDSGAPRVTVALTDAPREVLAPHADTKHHVEAAGGQHQQVLRNLSMGPTLMSP